MTDGKKNKFLLYFLLPIMLSGFLFRILVILYIGPGPHHELFPGMDEVDYRELAKNILYFHTYATWSEGFFTHSTRAPGYTVMLAAFYRLTDFSPWAPVILNCILDTLNIYLVFLLTSKLFNWRCAIITSCLYTIFGPSFSYIIISTPEIFAITLILTVCLSILNIKNGYKFISCILVGIFYAMLSHTRPVFLPITPLLCFCVWFTLPSFKSMGIKKKIILSILPMVIVGICAIPWAYRNYRIHKTFVPVCTIAGWHLFTSAGLGSDLSRKAFTDYIYDPSRKNFTEGEYYKEGLRETVKIALQHPVRLVITGILRLIYKWKFPSPFYRFLYLRAYLRPIYLSHDIFVPLPDFEGVVYVCIGLLGFILMYMYKRERRPGEKKHLRTCLFIIKRRTFPFILMLGGYAGIHIVGVPLIQYRFIIEPLIVIILVGTICFLFFELLEYRLLKIFPKNPKEPFEITKSKSVNITLQVLCFLLCTAIILPLLYTSKIKLIKYPNWDTSSQNGEYFNYHYLKSLQWLPNVNYQRAINFNGLRSEKEMVLFQRKLPETMPSMPSYHKGISCCSQKSALVLYSQDSSWTATWDPYSCKGTGSEICRVLRLQSCLPVLLYLLPMQKLWSYFCVSGERKNGALYSESNMPPCGRKRVRNVKNIFWPALGNLPPNIKGIFCGVLKYSEHGYKHIPYQPIAYKRKNWTTAKLYVHGRDINNPMGIGDIKVNFYGTHIPASGSIICVKGNVFTGTYKDFIVDVEEWKAIPRLCEP